MLIGDDSTDTALDPSWARAFPAPIGADQPRNRDFFDKLSFSHVFARWDFRMLCDSNKTNRLERSKMSR